MRAYSNDRNGDQLVNLIFSPDPALRFRHENVHQAENGLAEHRTERGSLLAVLQDGIACFQGYFPKPSRTYEKLFLEAEEWIGSNDDNVFSFNNVCEIMGLDPSRLRKGLERWKKLRITAASQWGLYQESFKTGVDVQVGCG